MKGPIIEVGERLGEGAESFCHIVNGMYRWDGYPNYERSDDPDAPQHVVKIPRLVRGAWQLNTEQFRRQCIQILIDAGIRHIPTTVIKDPKLVYSDGIKNANPLGYEPDMVQISPRIKNFGELTFGYQHLSDPKIQEQLFELAKKADEITKKHHIGLDPYGGEIVKDFMDGIQEEIFWIINTFTDVTGPEFVRQLIKTRLVGVKGQMRNILVGQERVVLPSESSVYYPEHVKAGLTTIIEPRELTLSDIGAHAMSKDVISDENLGEGVWRIFNAMKRLPVQIVTDPMQRLTWGTLRELLARANPELAEREKRFFNKREDSFPDQISRATYYKLSKAVVDFMVPRYERHEEYLRSLRAEG